MKKEFMDLMGVVEFLIIFKMFDLIQVNNKLKNYQKLST
jgi:hypothetical protein